MKVLFCPITFLMWMLFSIFVQPVCEHNVESLALNVIGQSWSGEKVSFFLEDWKLARVALSCHIALKYVVPGTA